MVAYLLPLSMRASELIKKLLAAGWIEVRQSGSHRIFKHPDRPFNISVPDHGGKDLAKGTANSILKSAELK